MKEGEEVKYFTPTLLASCRSSDPDVAEAAALKWQKHASAYRKRLQEIRPRLPLGSRQLIRFTTLHDARLLTLNRAEVRGRPNLFLSFQLAGGDGQAGVQLRYAGVKGFVVVLHAPNVPGDTELFALYDEFDVSADGTVTHSILMTAGVEIRVRFMRLLLTRLTRVVAPGRDRPDIKKQLEALEAS